MSQLTVQARLMLRPSTSADMGNRSLCSAPCLCTWAWKVRRLKLWYALTVAPQRIMGMSGSGSPLEC